MNDKYDEAFNEIVFAVARLIFGDTQATNPVMQKLVDQALLSLGVWDVIEGLKDDQEDN